VLLLHGGPAATHEYFEALDSYFPGEGIEYFYYDQLGSAYSDQPDKPALWTIPRFVDEVEQVRKALHLDSSNFYLLGHSWGGILAIEYALAHPDALKGLIVSNMMASIPAYNDYAKKVLMPAMDQKALAEILKLESEKKYEDPRYEELLTTSFYVQHIMRLPPEQWPDPLLRAFSKINKKIYIPMQGPSEMGASGVLEHWDRFNDLKTIKIPTLVIGATYDTMDPAYMEKMSREFPKGQFLLCPNGSHLAIYDDQKTYIPGLIAFIRGVDSGKFASRN
jgi:proline iminopeptidase